MTMVTTVNQIAFDEPMDDKMFEPPAPGATRKATALACRAR